MRPPLRAAIIGCGRMGTRAGAGGLPGLPPGWIPMSHAEAIRATPGLQLAALCDLDPGTLRAAGDRLGVDVLFTDYRDMIPRVRPEIVAVATRTPGRCEAIAFAAKAGVRGIHAEKPLANNLADADMALDAARAAGTHLTYGTTRRFMGTYRLARRLVEAGEVGQVQEVAVDHGRTLIMWNHAHSIDLLLDFAGTLEVEFVQAHCSMPPESARGLVVDCDPVLEHGYVRFANGVNGVVSSAGGFHTRVSGTEGVLTISSDGRGIEVWKRGPSSGGYHLDGRHLDPVPGHSGTVEAFRQLREAVLGGSPPALAPEAIRRGLQILLGFVRSSLQQGRRTSMDEIDPRFTVTGTHEGRLA